MPKPHYAMQTMRVERQSSEHNPGISPHHTDRPGICKMGQEEKAAISNGSCGVVSGNRFRKRRWNNNDGDILVALVGTLDGQTEIVGLDLGQGRKLSVNMSQVEASDLLVKNLGQHVDLLLEFAALGELDILLGELLVIVLVQHDLSEDLVAETARHDEGAVASGTAKVDKTALGQQDDVTAVLQEEAVNLGLDVLDRRGVGLKPGNIDLNVEVPNVCVCRVSNLVLRANMERDKS